MRFLLYCCLVCTLMFVSGTSAGRAELAPAQVITEMKRVADWQLSHPSKHGTTDWTQGVYYTGMMALWRTTHDDRYLSAMRSMGEANSWKLGPRVYHADDHIVGQTYCEIYALDKDPKEIAPMQAVFDQILANPKTQPLETLAKDSSDRWTWCDALFMAPAAWLKLANATGNHAYLDYMNKNYWDTVAFLYDPSEHLFFRDASFFNQLEPNGKKVFWGRGNGWVYAGLARILEAMPADYPDRPKYVKLYTEMSESLLKEQQPDGLWRTSLLNPSRFTHGEASASGLILFGMAWGINQKLLDPSTYAQPVMKGWSALDACVQPDGKLGWVQPVGKSPAKFTQDSTEVYGVGAYLLAGSEMTRLLSK